MLVFYTDEKGGTAHAASNGRMNVGIYKGAAAMAAYEHWQEAISQNLASSSVTGYRRNETSFSGVAGDLMKLKDGNSRVSKEMKGVLPDTHNGLSNMPGAIVATGVETNFAIEGEGFFRIRKPDGTIGYTRNGNFRLNEGRELVTQQGFTVDGENGSIKFRQEGGKILLNAEGRLVQGDQQLSKLPIYRFEKPTQMKRIGDGLLVPDAEDRAREPEKPVIVQMVLEGSNVAPLQEMVSLISVGRAYEMAKKVVEVHDDTLGKAIQTLGAPLA
ncbi:MAG: flagellar hook-basal body protein [Verrucomicrobiota bacterium]